MDNVIPFQRVSKEYLDIDWPHKQQFISAYRLLLNIMTPPDQRRALWEGELTPKQYHDPRIRAEYWLDIPYGSPEEQGEAYRIFEMAAPPNLQSLLQKRRCLEWPLLKRIAEYKKQRITTEEGKQKALEILSLTEADIACLSASH